MRAHLLTRARPALLIPALSLMLAACGGDTTNKNNGPNPTTTSDMGADQSGGVCKDLDGDGYTGGPLCVNAADCDDSSDQVNPGVAEVCANGRDDNCDGQIDEGCPCQTGELRLCSSHGDPMKMGGPQLRCKAGVQRCIDGEWEATCAGEVGPAEETCDGVDNDCDGQIDEDLRTPLGLCLDTLPPDYVPPGEDCGPSGEGDGFDNNGDGQIDEGCSCAIPSGAPGDPADLARKDQPCYSGLPQTLGVGECKAGTRSCSAQGVWGACAGEVTPVVEVCHDGLDNDCDGFIDEGCPSCTPGGQEVCDGVDNDCDGVIDEGLRNACGGCGQVASAEVCGDGLDNNCNGSVDEGCPCETTTQDCYPGPPEAAGVGACVRGTQQCNGEQYGACEGFVLPVLERCGEDGAGDGVDDDCDGQVDEGCGCPEGATRPCGVNAGVCAYGAQTCTGGAWGSCEGGVFATEPGAETSCDGLDNDCDGITDEGLKNACGKCGEACYAVVIDPTQTGNADDNVELLPANDPDNPRGKPGLTLKETTAIPSFLWAANSDTDGVSKVDTDQDQEVARYWVGDNPSRTAVDLDGNMWVIGRNDGRVTKVWASETDCEAGRDGDPTLNTSRRVGGNTPQVLNSAANIMADECVAYSEVINPGHPSGRGVAVDPNGTVWFGFSANITGTIQGLNARTFQKTPAYDGSAIPVWRPAASGGVFAPVSGETMNLGRIYGMTSDSRGDVWAVSLWDSRSLAKFNTGANGGTVGWEAIYDWPENCSPYGIALDRLDRLWVGCWGSTPGVGVFDPVTKRFQHIMIPASFWSAAGGAPANGATTPVTLDPAQAMGGSTSALAVEPATGDVWVTLEGTGYVLRLRYDEQNPAASQWTFIQAWRDANGNPTGGATSFGGTRGIGFDRLGFAWHLGLNSEHAMKIDPATNTRMLSVPMPGAGGHYTYSDFTGATLFSFIARRGTWRHYFDTAFSGASVASLTIEAHVPDDTSLSVRLRPLDANNNPIGPWHPAEQGGPQYLSYPNNATTHTFDLTSASPALVGHTFELDVVVTTQQDVRPIIYDLQLGWSRP